MEFSPFMTFSPPGDSGQIEGSESLDWKIISVISEILNFQVKIENN